MYENTAVNLSNNGNLLTVGAGGVLSRLSGSLYITSDGIGAVPVVTGLTGVTEKVGTIHRTVIKLSSLVISTVDATTNGSQGTQKLYTFPRGNILFLGGTSNLTTLGDGTGVIATAAVVSSIGTAVAGADATLTSTEANLVPSYAGTLIASAGVVKGKSTAQTIFDNTTTTNSTQLSANLNFDMPDASSTANGTITVSGTVELLWINLGDN